ncbi:MAG TPA: hypothetical protein VHY19_00560 [Steroidobacteraceae bacterium]|nr:hypothetical protein [Steroidobacteraceae bacterium]
MLAVAVCLLVGCGRAAAPAANDASSPSASEPADDSAASTSGDEAAPPSDADLVSAVNNGGPSKPLTVKFRVEARPVVGMPLKILLALTPADQISIDHLHASLAAGEGLLVQSPPSFDLSDLKAGTPQYREVTVVPQQTGVLDLSATLLLQTDKTTEARTYSIPLIAADNSSSP